MMLQLSHGTPPEVPQPIAVKLGWSLVSWCSRTCAPLTSDFLFHITPPSLRQLTKTLVQSPRENEWMSMWRLKGCVTHSPICSITVAKCCNVTHTWAHAHIAHSGYFKVSASVRCVTLQKLELPEKFSTFSSSVLFYLFYWVWVPQCDAEQCYCSAAQPHTTTRCLALDTYRVKRSYLHSEKILLTQKMSVNLSTVLLSSSKTR